MNSADFLLEIGCEEIPARMLAGAAADLAKRVTAVLADAGLAHGEARTLCTPRRLALIVPEVALSQASRDEEVLGPHAKAAFGADGKPTKAALGFAQKMGVEVSALATLATARGEYLGLRRHVTGRSASALLAETLPRAVAAISFPKTMRWADGSRRFVRPVHWVVALLGSEVVPLELFGVRAGRMSRGHRVLGGKTLAIAGPAQYEAALLAQGVAADRDARRRTLSQRLVELAGEEGVRPIEDLDLLQEVADLVEYPGAVLGSFPLPFLELPREVLVTTLRHHQKAFSTETDDGLSNRFLVVADIDRDALGYIRKGNEWVVIGRLEDARFFFQEDRKLAFETRRAKLAHVTFHARAGSYEQKSLRVEEIALALASLVDKALAGREPVADAARAPFSLPESSDILRAAARLAKCDLTTGLVGEFPELQGIAGGLYVGLEIEQGRGNYPRGVAEAIYDQYRPAGARDALPRTRAGGILALADRLDSLAVLGRCVGLPTGSSDPFGLRRAAYGAIRIAAEMPLPLALAEMVDTAYCRAEASFPRPDGGAGAEEILEFLAERFQFWLKERGARYDTINAVLRLKPAQGERPESGPGSAGDPPAAASAPASRGQSATTGSVPAAQGQVPTTESAPSSQVEAKASAPAGDVPRTLREAVPRLAEKVFALDRLRELPEFAALAEIHKRCRNILEQAESKAAPARPDAETKADPKQESVCAALAGQVHDAHARVGALMAQDDFEGALQRLVQLRPALTSFFEHVLVMHPEPALRAARLALVRSAAVMIEEVADLKQISMPREALQKLLARMKAE